MIRKTWNNYNSYERLKVVDYVVLAFVAGGIIGFLIGFISWC
jgi:hypothetical protein